MNTFAKASIALCALVLAMGFAASTAQGEPRNDTLDQIIKLQNQVAGLQAKVTALESKVQQLQERNVVIATAVPESVSPEVHIPIQVTPQSEILKIYRRGMFVPAEAR